MQLKGIDWSEFAKSHEARGIAKGEARGRAEGEARGRAEALLTLLEARGLAVTDEQRARILACTDRASLERWIVAAVSAESTDEAID